MGRGIDESLNNAGKNMATQVIFGFLSLLFFFFIYFRIIKISKILLNSILKKNHLFI